MPKLGRLEKLFLPLTCLRTEGDLKRPVMELLKGLQNLIYCSVNKINYFFQGTFYIKKY